RLLQVARAPHRLPDEDGDRHAQRGGARLRDPAPPGGDRLMYVIVAGGGKVGANVARSLLRLGSEVTLIEQRRDRFQRLEDEFEHQVQRGDATELHVLERAGIARPPDIVLALTGDDEDNLVIAQLAKEKYGVEQVIARVNDPRNQAHFDLLGISPTVCATSNIMALVEHEVPEHDIIHLLELRRENLEIVEVMIGGDSPSVGKRVEALALPEGSRHIAVTRDGQAEIASSAIYLKGVEGEDAIHDALFVTTSYGSTLAIDADDGSILWQYTPPSYANLAGSVHITTATPVADPSRLWIYAASPDGRIQKLSVEDGEVAWRVPITKLPLREKISSPLNYYHGNVIA